MAAEKKTGVKVETSVAPSLRKKFKRHCAKLNKSVAQHLRDLMQKDLKNN